MGTKLITGAGALNTLVRFSFTADVFNRRTEEDGKEGKYQVQVLIRKTDKATIAAINAAIEAEKKEWMTKNGKRVLPSGFKTPLRDGDEKADQYPYMSEYMFINASSKRKPQVVGRAFEPITHDEYSEVKDECGLYSGSWGRVSIDFYPFTDKSSGVACGLNSIQMFWLPQNGALDASPLGGGASSASADFKDTFTGTEADYSEFD